MTISGFNPTNLRPLPNGQLWRGQTGVENNLCVFSSAEYGIRAAAKNLRAYGHAGINTIRKIFAAWAPSGDEGNDPWAYAEFVAKQAGFGIDDFVNLEYQTTLVAIIKESSLQENGFPPNGDPNWYSDETFAAGVAMAFQ